VSRGGPAGASGRQADATDDGRRALIVQRLGLVPYEDGLALQEDLVTRRRAGDVPDTLVVLEHPHVITLGSSTGAGDVLATPEELERLGIGLFRVGRGGAATYHGPGQLVAYPVLDLKPDRRDLHRYLRDLETVLLQVTAEFGVRAYRREGLTGIWTDAGKLGAVGVRVSSQWITSHGVALNVSADLGRFDAIVACGLPGERVTSLERELATTLEMDEVVRVFVARFAEVFERAPVVA
jgi:lipoyl(octanoyl) transferase